MKRAFGKFCLTTSVKIFLSYDSLNGILTSYKSRIHNIVMEGIMSLIE